MTSDRLRGVARIISIAGIGRTVLLAILLTANAMLDAAGVFYIMPLLWLVSTPELVETNRYFHFAFVALGLTSWLQLVVVAAVAGFGLLLITATFRAATFSFVIRGATHVRHELSTLMLRGYTRRPYEFFLGRNSVELTRTVLGEVDGFVERVYLPCVNVLSYGAVSVLFIVLIIFVSPTLAASMAAILIAIYTLVYGSTANRLRELGRRKLSVDEKKWLAASEILAGIRDLKVLRREEAFLRRFTALSSQSSGMTWQLFMNGHVPKLLIETLAVGVGMFAIVYLMAAERDLRVVLPELGTFVFSGYRLLPALHSIYLNLATMRSGLALANKINAELDTLPPDPADEPPDPLALTRVITFTNVSYRYPANSRYSLRGVTIAIEVGTKVGLIGESGAGKSTMAELLLGLMSPTEGVITIDGTPLTEANAGSWQRNVGYVGQQIFLLDDTIERNIAFGIEPDHIDHAAIVTAAQAASLHDFVVGQLPDGYQTIVGERGIRLSGGQRQRIGIARALYHNPAVLVLDEATSALDDRTEREVIEAIARWSGQRTVLTIAHRLTTLYFADRILRLKDGCLVEERDAVSSAAREG